jgi:putative salt-induced outer membrane protein YdiY
MKHRTFLRPSFLWALALATQALFALPSSASAPQGSWAPDPPMPDDYDWVQLPSGEWLKGEINVMYQDTLEFDSDELDLLDLDWRDLLEIRSAQILQVRARGNRIAVGQLLLKDGEVTVLGATPGQFGQEEIISITAGVPKEINFWKVKVSFGATAREGNSKQVEANSRVDLRRRTVKNRIRLEYNGNYTSTEGVETANNHLASVQWDRFVTDRFFWRPLFAEYFSDRFRNIDRRWTVGAGIGYQIIDTSETEWSVSAGPAYQTTTFSEVEQGESGSKSSVAATMQTLFERELTDWIDFTWDYSVQVAQEDAGGYSHNMAIRLEIELTDRLDIDLGTIWDRTGSPQPDADGILPEKDDWRYTIGLGWEF